MDGSTTWIRPLPAILASVLAAGCARPTAGFQTRTFRGPDGQEARYTLFVPHNYTPETPVPVILFLHGGGEAGTDGRKPIEVGLGPAIRAREASFPFLVIFPQAQEFVPAMFGSWNPGRPDGDRALALLDAVQKEFRTDPRRVYLTGISVGGYGVWQLAAASLGRWAAIVPMCGRAAPTRVDALARIPCWCFHGVEDPVVPVEDSRRMVEALKKAGGTPRYTEYPGVGHNCWDQAYATDELYTWLLRQQKR
jgi:predicted peptidase